MLTDPKIEKPNESRGSPGPRAVYEASSDDCPLPAGVSHRSVKAFYKGCRCPEAEVAVDRRREARRIAFRSQTSGLAPRDAITVVPTEEMARAERVMTTGGAACAETDPELFFGDNDSAETRIALALCERCPIRDACLITALERGERFGVFGGKTPRQRHAIRRRLYRQQQDAAGAGSEAA